MFLKNSLVIESDIKEITNSINHEDFLVFENKKILITGVTGLIGIYILFFFIYINKKFSLNLSLFTSSRDPLNAAKKVYSYISSEDIKFINYSDEYTESPYDYIFHTASSTNPFDLVSSPVNVIENNVIDTARLLKLLRNKESNFIFFSTREIYGKKINENIKFLSEDQYGVINPLEIRSAYPMSKKMAENLIFSHGQQFSHSYMIYRIAHTYGPFIKLSDGRILSDIIGSMVNNKNIYLKSDGAHKISPTYIGDVISGVIFSLLKERNVCLNISNDHEIYSILDIAGVAKNINNKVQIHFSLNNEEKNSKLYLKHDTGILSSDTIRSMGWNFKINLFEGVNRTYKHFKLNGSFI